MAAVGKKAKAGSATSRKECIGGTGGRRISGPAQCVVSCRVEDEARCRDAEMLEMLRCAGLHWRRRWQEMLGRLPDGFGLAFPGRCCSSSTLDLVFGALPGSKKGTGTNSKIYRRH